MATLKQIAYEIAERQGRATDSAFIEQTKFEVEAMRSLLFRRDFERNNVIPLQLIQSIRGLDVIEIDITEIPGLDVGCKIYRTKKQIPAPMNLKGMNAFTFVGTVDLKRNYSYIEPIRLGYLKFNRYDQTPMGYFYLNGYLYLTVNPKKISIMYVIDEPSKLGNFIGSDGMPVFTEDSDYPITMEMVTRVTTSILSSVANTPKGDDHEINVDE